MMDTARQKRKHRLPLSASRTRASLSIFLPFFLFFSLPSVPLLSSGSWLRGCRCCCDAAFWGFVPATCLRMEKMFMCSGTLYPPYTQFLSGQKRLWNMYLNRWTLRYSGKIKRISFLVYHWKKKKYFHAEINWCWSNRLEIKYKCTVQVMKSSRSFGFAICKPVNTKQRNSKLERGIWRAKLCKRKIIKQICVSVSLQELNVKSVCRRPVIGYLWDMFLKPWRVINKTNSNRNIIGLIFQSGPASLQSAKRDIN